jgi:hypothetical protein
VPFRPGGTLEALRSALEFGIFRFQGQTYFFVEPWAGEVKELFLNVIGKSSLLF